MRLDAHQHFWKYSPTRDTWIDETMGVLKSDFLPSDLEPILIANEMQGCLAVQADQSEEETKFLLQLASHYSFVKGVVGWVDLFNTNLEKRLEYFCQNSYFKGVRHIVQAEEQNFMLREDFQEGIAKLNRFDLTYDILIYPHQLESAIALVNQFPEQQFVLDHLAKPKIKSREIDEWEASIRVLAQCQNVSCKISGMVTEADHKNWKTEDFTAYLDVVFESFGEDRILFGSDWPVCLLAASYESVLAIVEGHTKHFSTLQKEKLFGKNAARIYKIKE